MISDLHIMSDTDKDSKNVTEEQSVKKDRRSETSRENVRKAREHRLWQLAAEKELLKNRTQEIEIKEPNSSASDENSASEDENDLAIPELKRSDTKIDKSLESESDSEEEQVPERKKKNIVYEISKVDEDDETDVKPIRKPRKPRISKPKADKPKKISQRELKQIQQAAQIDALQKQLDLMMKIKFDAPKKTRTRNTKINIINSKEEKKEKKKNDKAEQIKQDFLAKWGS